MGSRFRIDWKVDGSQLSAVEPSLQDVAVHAPTLATAYNDPLNAAAMGSTAQMSVDDVVEHYRGLLYSGARPFLLYRNGELVGDADLRRIEAGRAEFAFLIASRAAQGQGLGTRFALMIHVLGFARLALERIYVTIVPSNAASRRVFDKLGYQVDDGAVARAYVDEAEDVAMSVGKGALMARWADEARTIEGSIQVES